ncbi:MAG: AbrB/MazE/SpoVT family DNA-binding domain-containing protein [Lentisphaerae bacterium]|nr:AbrB/MazE/SpoVT family DNA-binding domain-containing protein [Lentisphaerota bacterium]
MIETIQINSRGSMTLPKGLRKSLGLERGGVVMVEPSKGGILLRPAVAYPIEIYTDERVREFEEENNKLQQHLRRKARP